MSDLITRNTITEIVAYRDAALKAYEEAHDAIAEAHKRVQAAKALVQQAAPLNHAYTHAHAPEVEAFEKAVAMPDRDLYLRTARRLTDIRVWGHLIQHTELEHLMDKQAKDQLRKQMAFIPEQYDRNTGALINQDEIDKGLPPVSVEIIEATLKGFAEDATTIFRRGLANAFSDLDRRFRSHDGFKIGSRVILSRAFDEYGHWNYHRAHRDTLIDIERIFLILDGKSPREAYGGIVGLVDVERKSGGVHQSEIVGEFFKVRIFQNGNAHLWFTRKDLVAKANRELALFYGEVVGDGNSKADEVEEDYTATMSLTPARHFGFFPTPRKVVERVVEEARIWKRSGEPALRVLEPSAGTGNLVQALANEGAMVTAIEIQPELVETLINQGAAATVRQADFLKLDPTPIFDRVVMNPPFDRERDIDHVRHALEFLKPGGRLVAVMSAGVEFRETKKAITFRKFVDTHGGKIRDLPQGSFAESGTNVNTAIVVIDKKETTK